MSDETYQAHRGDGLFQREENSTRRFLIVHVAEQSRLVGINAFHADAFDLRNDFAPLVLALVEIQQAVHAAVRALAVAFLKRTRINERERLMLELELIQFRQPLRAGEVRGLRVSVSRINFRAGCC